MAGVPNFLPFRPPARRGSPIPPSKTTTPHYFGGSQGRAERFTRHTRNRYDWAHNLRFSSRRSAMTLLAKTSQAAVILLILSSSPLLAQPAALPADQLKRIKDATVYIKVVAKEGPREV